jgi:hypothetical protein
MMSRHVDRWDPEAKGVCDRCQRTVNRSELRWQMEWRGNRLASTGVLVCERDYDVPQPQSRTLTLGPDPLPVIQPRPPDTVGSDQYLGSFTKAALPAAAVSKGHIAFASNATGGGQQVWSDGVTWRYFGTGTPVI